jgi:hypothetical protein
MTDRAAKIIRNAGHEGHSRDRFGANNLNIVAGIAAARIANIPDTGHPRTESRREHRPVPEGWARQGKVDLKLQWQ